MKRVTSNLMNDNMQFHLRNREFRINELQNKMATQSRIKNLRDDPVSAAHSTRYQSFSTRLKRYVDNVEYAKSNHSITEGYMAETVNILHRVRELAIQGANGTFTKSDLGAMGAEVNQLLNELIELSNSRNGDGSMIFAGNRTRTEPFRVLEGNVEGGDGKLVTDVQYIGDIGERYAEVGEGSYMRLNFPGNEVFWAENQQIFSSIDATNYQVPEDASIRIDGVSIDLSLGDTVHNIISKINNSDAAVKARLDPVRNSLVLQSTSPHQIWVEDGPDSTVMQDLGILKGNGADPPHNIAPDARRYGGSMFDMVIYLRDSLLKGDHIDIGGSAIQGIDEALDNLLAKLGDLGAQYERLEIIGSRLAKEIPEVAEMNSKEVDLDLTSAITDLKMLEYTHRAALQTAGRILQPTLMDFLR